MFQALNRADGSVMTSSMWLLIADSSRGLLYEIEGHGNPWRLVEEYSHAASRISQGGLSSDQPGRAHGGTEHSARSAVQSKTSPKEVESEHFAHELADVLNKGHGQQAYHALVLVAPPHFLGLLRKAISPTVSKLIAEIVDKDLVHLKEEALMRHLGPLTQKAEERLRIKNLIPIHK